MTKDELNRLVSESIEPKPEQPPSAPLTTFATLHSPLRAWRWLIEDRWEPHDFHVNEAANAWLLEMMPEPELWLESNQGEPKVWGCCADLDKLEGNGMHSDRKTAIVLAFAKWKGVEVDG